MWRINKKSCEGEELRHELFLTTKQATKINDLGALLAPFAASIVKPVISSVLKGISGIGSRRAGREYIDKKMSVPLHPLSNIEITKYFNYKLRSNGFF